MPNREMDEPARRWVIKTARRNMWRVLHWYEPDDLIADGYLCWQIVCSKYPHIQERRHLMSLFQRTYTNHIHKLSIKRTTQSIEATSDDIPDMELSPEVDDSDLRRFAGEQKGAMRALLHELVEHPEVLKRPHRRRLGGRRETSNEYFCGILGLDPKRYDLDRKLRELLELDTL